MIDFYPVIACACLCFVCYMIGLFVGLWSAKKRDRVMHVGSLVINYDDPEKELLGFRFDKDLDEIERAPSISFDVIIEGSPDSDPDFSPDEISQECF